MPTNINIDLKIKRYLPDVFTKFIRDAGNLAEKRGYKLYLVGGAVRDLLLGLTNHPDLDVVVEGDAVALARALPTGNGKIEIYPSFNTAKVKWGKLSIDLATARAETYAKPGALPDIIPSTIEKDLSRRDFTINAMAVSLNPGSYGELFDKHQGLTDLQKKLIRTLHKQSFTDDATRIWRAIRYEQRLDFEIEPETLRLLKRDLNMLDTISGDRIRYELEMVLQEKLPEKALRRASELKILSFVHPSLTGDSWLAEKFEESRELGLSEPSLMSVYLALFFFRLAAKELESVINRLHFSKTISQILLDTITLKNEVNRLNNSQVSPSEIYFTLCKYSSLAIIANSLATDATTVEQNIDTYLTRLSHIKSRLNGDDLKRMGVSQGPEIKRILNMLHAARLDGKAKTKQGEVRLVYSWLEKNKNKG